MSGSGSAARLAANVAIVTVLSGCASSRLAPRFHPSASPGATQLAGRAGASAKESRASFKARIQRLIEEARRTARSSPMVTTVEATDPALREALARLVVDGSPAAHRAVAAAYQRVGIKDTAYQHLSEAIRLDPRDAAAYDARARLWRDLGMPQLGLGDAHRAVYFARQSPVAHNTLGTVLEALGQLDAAHAEYAKALTLDQHAWYARANVDRLVAVMAARQAQETLSP